jgi:carbamoyl-phosphate synthase small subunit
MGLRQRRTASRSRGQEAEVAERRGYPVLVRPSFVLGGRGMQVCNHAGDVNRYIDGALGATDREVQLSRSSPILIEKFLLDAIEVDVDAIADYGYPGRDPSSGRCDICGIMEHIEEAGIHSGDSCCVLPPYSLSPALVDELKYQVKVMARRLGVCGLMNVQFAIQGGTVYVIEVNPRASRTIPFVSKATGVPWAQIATQVMLGRSLDEALARTNLPAATVVAGTPAGRRADARATSAAAPRHFAVKAPVFPFKKLQTVDFALGPEMKSTGEVMGIDPSYALAFAKALLAAGLRLPTTGRVLVSVCDADKPRVISIARELHELGFEIFSTLKTRDVLLEHHIPAVLVSKHDGRGAPFLLEKINARELDLLIKHAHPHGQRDGRGPLAGRVHSPRHSADYDAGRGPRRGRCHQGLAGAEDGGRGVAGLSRRRLAGPRGGRGTGGSALMRCKLALENGCIFAGQAFGAAGTRAGEVVFNTALTGYQEVFTDPSYCRQIVTMTYPLLGNTGINPEDFEAREPFLAGVVIKELPRRPSNYRATRAVDDFLAKHGIVGLADVDTRALTRRLRISGALRGVLSTEIDDDLELVRRAQAAEPMSGANLVPQVATKEVAAWDQPLVRLGDEPAPPRPTAARRIVALDCGIKHNILRHLAEWGGLLTVVPASASAAEIRALRPAGLLVGNGPGDPAAVTDLIATLRSLLGAVPMLGICLGHQLLALAMGAQTYKLSFGHHGANMPVLNRISGRVEITSQNHGLRWMPRRWSVPAALSRM